MDSIRNGWFSETSDLWPGQCLSLKVKEVLHTSRSKYQDILVFESTDYGRVLVLDGVIQCTDRDEFSYQEMIAHLPLYCHPNPVQVLIVGGGDGGVAREVCKHPSVKSITMCEIDEDVIKASKKFFPKMSTAFDDPKLDVVIADGFDFLAKHKKEYDVIITDSSDPIGPACSLFQKSYYELLKASLKPGGVICAQGECMWLHLDIIKDMQSFCKELFPVVDYAYCTVPTYPSGQIGFLLCSNNLDMNFRDPVRKISATDVDGMKLRYYNSEIHRASFVLPEFVKKALKEGVKKVEDAISISVSNGHSVSKEELDQKD